MERETPTEGLSDDTVKGALARRKKFLGKEKMDPTEISQMQACMCGVPTTEARAIDKSTALALFQKRFPGHKGIGGLISTETGSLSLDNGLVVYRLSNGDWIEPIIGHWIPSCFPWAQMFEWKLQEETAHFHAEHDEQDPIPNLQKETAEAARAKIQESSR
ncbi:MAG: hypothetical protein V1876_02610 [Candidatus Peregrinibacteria bacterium]